ncbi:unnamed protein product [Paramecium pentaurelia]|uniref:WD domain, G-beta repeat protein n=1 Tax=Paramecium pentaurelia TaxID=43138 RepID=A0A8S1V0E0_9CILI|nr:unnamed protein product [Paramecium pentaurelia]
MFMPKMIENILELQCHQKHSKPISAIRLGQYISNEKRLYCEECSKLNDIQIIPLTLAVELSKDSIEKKLRKFQNLFVPLYDLLLKLQSHIFELKSQLFKNFHELEIITEDWINFIQVSEQQITRYSLFDELDQLIINQKQTQYQIDEKIINDYKNVNLQQLTKVNSTLVQFKDFTNKFRDCFKIIIEISKQHKESQLKSKINFQDNQSLSDQLVFQKSSYFQSKKSIPNVTSLEFSKKVTENMLQFQFKLLQQSFKQQEECNAFAINHNNTILLAALNNSPLFSIKIIQMSQQQEKQENKDASLNLKVIQILEGNHDNFVTTLNFFSSTPMRDSFISGSSDTTIIIWSPTTKQNNLKLFWNPLIKLFGHQSIILCLVLHHEENLFISGGSDNKIKFWTSSIQQQWFCKQTVEEHSDKVYGLSLNDSGNQLISCGNDKQILVIQNSNNKEWDVKQKIKILNIGFRISFITNKLFAFQPSSQAYLHFYELNSFGEFVNTEGLQVKGVDQCCDCFFPSVYIPLKGIMLLKNGQNINIIQFSFFSQNWGCQLIQAIEFETQKFLQGRIYGTISADGHFIVTWDVQSKQIQIRQQRMMI